ncbi:hypothetical protein JTE90_003487 [Oedothorax gibbosus]|uniref:PiggyBac transposable element-derived protein domain-containing protein n=1 Tax=Oedothorax gibbosus TaxID=931172 RepID=A0AAV6UGC3_9ARAC|nr:hypothetical protein JTE90_003487 [Oedothorax gibbosus]
MHRPTANSLDNDSDELKKPGIINSYNKNMGSVDLSDRMANSYGSSRKTMKWPKKIFFHFLNIAVMNAFVLFKMKKIFEGLMSPASLKKLDHKTFCRNLISQMIELNGEGAELPKREAAIRDGTFGPWPEKPAKHWHLFVQF